MNRVLVIVASVTLALHSAAAISAQRTFVASGGSDANPCSIAQPCRGFAAAITHTDANGEIIVLDSAGYGAVTIDKSVSIIAPPGVYAGISVFPGQVGVTIAAGAADKIVLRGLAINGQGGGYGIVINQAGRVDIQRCAISNMTNTGIRASPGASQVYVDDTRLSNNAANGVRIEGGDFVMTRSHVENNGGIGVYLYTTGTPTTIQAVVRSTFIAGNDHGLEAAGNGSTSAIHVTVEETAAVRNTRHGFSAFTASGALITFVLSRSVSSRNGGVGFNVAGPTVTASAYDSTLARNYTFDMRQLSGAVLRSHGNNALSGDGPGNVSGTITQVGLD